MIRATAIVEYVQLSLASSWTALLDMWEIDVDSLTDCAFLVANCFCNKGGPRTEPPGICRVEGTAGWLTRLVCLGLCWSSSPSGARHRGVSPQSPASHVLNDVSCVV